MANNWKYFQATGLEGGTPNAAQNLYYVDSHNGSDVTGDGSHDNPYQTIQKVHDQDTTCDIVLAGIFSGNGIAGGLTSNHAGALIAEGEVIFDGTGVSLFNIGNAFNTGSYQNGGQRFDYGRCF